MMDNTEKDKRLVEDLDLILTGQESKIPEPGDSDARTALDFARKMAALREKPSKEFKANLKAQLIHQLAEQQKKERLRQEFFLLWGIEIPRTRWQRTVAAATAVIIMAIILLIILLLNRGG